MQKEQKKEELYNNIETPWGEIGYITFKRTYARRLKEDDPNSKTEEFKDVVERELRACNKQLKVGFTAEEEELYRSTRLQLKWSVAGRFMWQLGTKTVDKLGLPSLQNCAACVVDEPIRPFTWAFEMLMLGSGVGYNIQRENVYQIPKLKGKIDISRSDNNDVDFIVPDNREGWVKLLAKVLKAHFYSGKSFTYSLTQIRSKGSIIKGFGGIASGSEDLYKGIEQIHQVLNNRSNKKLRSIDCLDIMNIIGTIVVSGNVRRSAQLAIGDYDDIQFLQAKRWDLGNVPNWRAMSNNSVACNDINKLPKEFWDTYLEGEPYGLINLELSRICGRLSEFQYKDTSVQCYNPCQPKWATVITPKGLSTIGDISIGDHIWSETGWTKVINKWSTGIKKVKKYQSTSGVFYGTENHRLVSNGEKVEAKDCTSVDSLRGNSVNHSNGLYNYLMYQDIVDGLVIGDGSMHKASNNKIFLNIGKDDQDYFTSDIKDYIGKKLGIGPYAYDIKTTITHLDNTLHRTIPKDYFSDKDKLRFFLKGLYSANGSVVSNRITFKTASKKLQEDLQLALSYLGIKSYFTTNQPTKVKFSNGDYTCKESYDINISTDIDKFKRLIGFLQKYKNSKVQDILDKHIKKSDRINYKIVSIEDVSEEEVFNITVDNSTHTYWSGGLNISNCAEQGLFNKETCCLAETFLPNINSYQELLSCLELAYRVNKHSLALHCSLEDTESIVHQNMRMGIGMTGVLQASEEQRSWLKLAYEWLREYDIEYSKKHGFNVSIKLTTVKPSGTLSLLAGVTPGVHPNPAGPYYIRRIRIASNSPLIEVCKKNGYFMEYQINFDGSKDNSTIVVSFPCSLSESTPVASNYSWKEQLEMVKFMQTNWSDNSVSCTIYYKKEDLEDIKQYLKENYKDNFKTLSFLLYHGHGFIQAPYETITKEQYELMIQDITPITSVNILESDFEIEECGGACPIK